MTKRFIVGPHDGSLVPPANARECVTCGSWFSCDSSDPRPDYCPICEDVPDHRSGLAALHSFAEGLRPGITDDAQLSDYEISELAAFIEHTYGLVLPHASLTAELMGSYGAVQANVEAALALHSLLLSKH